MMWSASPKQARADVKVVWTSPKQARVGVVSSVLCSPVWASPRTLSQDEVKVFSSIYTERNPLPRYVPGLYERGRVLMGRTRGSP